MSKIEIKADDGRVLKISDNNFIYYRDTDGNDIFWEWEHVSGKAEEFKRLFAQADEQHLQQTALAYHFQQHLYQFFLS